MYEWIKAFHIMAVIAWMAGMLYLPRLFVYHAEAEIGSKQSETFKVMERRLLRAIINPAMVVTWATGLWLGWRGFQFMGGWLHTLATRIEREATLLSEFAARLPSAHLTVVPGAGHMPHQTHPQVVLEAIARAAAPNTVCAASLIAASSVRPHFTPPSASALITV